MHLVGIGHPPGKRRSGARPRHVRRSRVPRGIRAAEHRIRARGLHRAELSVEDSNPRARALYDRLGYRAYGHEPDSWDQEAPDRTITRYYAMVTLMRKELP
jgi:ribosomal protein S18 acetylase RimI-like enzyme